MEAGEGAEDRCVTPSPVALEPFARPRPERSVPKRRPFIRFRMRRRGADDFGCIVLSTEAQRLLSLGHRDRVLLLLDRERTVMAIERVPSEKTSAVDNRQFLVSRWGGQVVILCTPLVRALLPRIAERARYLGEISGDAKRLLVYLGTDGIATDGAQSHQ